MKTKAFSLIETLMGITMITVVLTAVTGLLILTLNVNDRNMHLVQANAFAAEGMEVMRFVRDSNWLQNYSWDEGANLWKSDFNVDEGPLTLYMKEAPCPPCYNFSWRESDGWVENSKGFPFLRRIDLKPYADDEMEVTVTVEWRDKATTRNIEISSFLSNWQ
jgi:hypothetical protein